MEDNINDPNAKAGALYNYTMDMLVTKKMKPWEVKKKLEDDGASPETADKVVDMVKQQYNKEVVRRANKNMLAGGLWCLGGTAVTVISFAAGGGRFILAWGAIIFGAIQFFSGYSLRDKQIY